MAGAGVRYPSVFVVDKETLPPLPPKPGHMRGQARRNRLIQNTLFLIVCIILFGLAVEGYFIYNLYRKNPEPVSNKTTNKKSMPIVLPSKPTAHLTAGKEKANTDGVMLWNLDPEPILYELKYEKGKLLVEKEGYYYVYSKIWFKSDGIFIHMVQKETPRYRNKPLDLLSDRRYQLKPAIKGSTRSSYLGGVFYFYMKDAVFVHVNNSSLVCLHTPADNFFGMFML
ncbi:tumor necrosis factor ligand superfamily member 14-like [Trichomycterus rosablanca]|uniref:tumor necrosis factor ligand superfamily member 14-like n=1 Tax=Trichomycterus rosablanca TaxID=2290929 RepID=UPI002F3568C0